jgi:hypothetical protein
MPRYDGASLVNVTASLFDVAFGAGPRPAELAPPLRPELDPWHGRAPPGPVVLLLIDGLGYHNVLHWASTGSVRAQRWLRLTQPITTVFPSTTTTALTSLSTAVAPAGHGLVGYRQYLPRYGVVADLLKMSPVGLPTRDTLIGPTWTPADISGAPTLFRRGMTATAVTRELFAGTGFTRLLYDGAEFVGYATGADLARKLEDVLARPTPPRWIFGYFDELDTIQHLNGPDPTLIDLEVERIAHLVEHLAARLPARVARTTTLLVTGDHGQVPATPAARLAVETFPEVLAEMSRPLAGDRRAGFFAARPGRTAALAEALERILPPGSPVVRMDEALEQGLFGPPPYHPEIEQRLGDLLVLVASPAGLVYLPPGAGTPPRHLFGAHGGLEPEELVVPLAAGPLAAFGPSAGGSPKKR